MNTFDQIRNGFGNAWHNLSEGWQHLSDRATHALTRFNPVHGTGSTTELSHASRWGFLAAEVHEDNANINVKLEVPGLEPSDIDIEVRGNAVLVRGEKRSQSERESGRYHITECAYGSFERTIPLAQTVDQENAKASYKNGVLEISLPKSEQTRKNRIKISG